MRAVHILLPPETEAVVQRVAIGKGQPEYSTIPAVAYPDTDTGMVAFLSRWQPEHDEGLAMARSSVRSALMAFAEWTAQQQPVQRIHPFDMRSLVEQFVAAHPESFGGEDATLWYTQLVPPNDGFQPIRLVVSVNPPIEAAPAVLPSTLPKMPEQTS